MSSIHFAFTGAEQQYIIPISGWYKLEVWGAQGGFHHAIGLSIGGWNPNTYSGMGVGGYGGYSIGVYYAMKDTILYVYVGGRGNNESLTPHDGGWNGGGSSTKTHYTYHPSGGGATDVSLVSSDITIDAHKRSIRSYQSYISRLIVGGGGGGGCRQLTDSTSQGRGGSGGGLSGGTGEIGYRNVGVGKGGLQHTHGEVTNSGCSQGEFGYGSGTMMDGDGASGGGGWWGGNEANDCGGGGGSGYIGSVFSILGVDARMYCYNCQASDIVKTHTISTDDIYESPTPNAAKIGDGYAIITFLSKNPGNHCTYDFKFRVFSFMFVQMFQFDVFK